jgi:hypothetical protein
MKIKDFLQKICPCFFPKTTYSSMPEMFSIEDLSDEDI